jgi:hypothetical protein
MSTAGRLSDSPVYSVGQPASSAWRVRESLRSRVVTRRRSVAAARGRRLGRDAYHHRRRRVSLAHHEMSFLPPYLLKSGWGRIDTYARRPWFSSRSSRTGGSPPHASGPPHRRGRALGSTTSCAVETATEHPQTRAVRHTTARSKRRSRTLAIASSQSRRGSYGDTYRDGSASHHRMVPARDPPSDVGPLGGAGGGSRPAPNAHDTARI